MSRFFCDTNSEIDFEVFKSLGISLIKMPYTVDGREYYYDLGENTDLTAFFSRMRRGAIVKTQALNSYDYVEYFEPVFAAGEDILYVSFSHKMSATFESLWTAADQLKEKYPKRKITLVDTKSISQGAGAIVEYAARLHNEGASDEAIKIATEEYAGRVAVYFTVDDLEYLRRGGRLSRLKSFMGTLLSMKPLISVNPEGFLENIESVKGRKAALKYFITEMENGVDFDFPVTILQADSSQDLELLAEMIAERFPKATIKKQAVGPVVGCHCGPGTIGLVFTRPLK
ncbi:MAG: DegV family protein [Firmicutes bacterium]|nr:DegV family protein [Bacillota bacterium]